MKKRIGAVAISVAGIAAAAAIGAGTYAYFSDSQSDEVTAQAGTLFLEGFGAESLGDWVVSDLAPGDDGGTKTVTITNGGSVTGDLTVTLEANGTGLDNGCAGDVDGTPAVEGPEVGVDAGCVNATDNSELPAVLSVKVHMTDPDGVETDATVDLTDSDSDGTYEGALAALELEANESVELELTLNVDSSAENEIQSDGADLTVTADLQQA